MRRIRELITAVVVKVKSRVSDLAKTLAAAGVPNTVLDGDTVGPGVRVATMHRVKGLDFTHVVMCWPGGAPASPDPRDQSLLYVAATRPRKTLTVVRRAL